jgi:hypothetical protein
MSNSDGSNTACCAGFGAAVINPEPGLGLAGYFNERPNTGVLDDLQVKVFLVACDGMVNGLISYDLVSVSLLLIARIRQALMQEGFPFSDAIPLAATHTHTGPDVGGVLHIDMTGGPYFDLVCAQTVCAVKAALADMAPAELFAGSVQENPLAFNRRYWMKDGMVTTNPGKLNSGIVKPEGTVDREIGLLAVKREGAVVGMVANICNHSDTTGGDKVSADWPGHLERAMQERLGVAASVITLIVPAGNVNHFDLSTDRPQTSYDEAKRIGEGYAEILHRLLPQTQPIRPCPVRVDTESVAIHLRDIPEEKIEEARRILAQAVGQEQGDMTSEGLARGAPIVRQWFADQLLKYLEWATPEGRRFDLAALKFSDDFAIVCLPGEPFTEVSLAIKAASPFKSTFVSELTNGACGYVALRECFDHGGYETRPVLGGGPREDTRDLLIEMAGKLLRR